MILKHINSQQNQQTNSLVAKTVRLKKFVIIIKSKNILVLNLKRVITIREAHKNNHRYEYLRLLTAMVAPKTDFVVCLKKSDAV